MPYRDFREYLDVLEKEGELKRVKAPFKGGRFVNELYALRYYVGMKDGPALLLENIEDLNTPGVPVVLNPFGSTSNRRIAYSLEERDWHKARDKHMKAVADPASWLQPVLVDRKKAPCKDVIIRENEVDLRKQVPEVWFGKEMFADLTGGVIISKDPETGMRNMNPSRWGRMDLDLQGKPYPEEKQKRWYIAYVRWNPPVTHCGMHAVKAQKKGKRLEVAMAMMCDPAIHIAGSTGIPYGMDEFALAGALRGAPVELVKCETIDLEVPATAEWVLECELVLDEQEMHSHPCFSGYVTTTLCPTARVKCITHRKNPMWYALNSDKHGMDHANILEFTYASQLLSELRAKFPYIKDVVCHPRPNYVGMTVVQLEVDGKDRPLGFPQQVMSAVWGSGDRYGKMQKYVVIVGPDIDPWDLWDVTWALCTRVQPISDITLKKGAPRLHDPSAIYGASGKYTSPLLSEQMGIDATIKIPERYSAFAETTPLPSAEDIEKVKAKLGDIFGK